MMKQICVIRASGFLPRVIVSSLLLISCSVFGGPVGAQAPPGPMGGTPSRDPEPPPRPQVQKAPIPARTSIFGEWSFNRSDSDDPAQKLQEARSRQSSSNGG